MVTHFWPLPKKEKFINGKNKIFVYNIIIFIHKFRGTFTFHHRYDRNSEGANVPHTIKSLFGKHITGIFVSKGSNFQYAWTGSHKKSLPLFVSSDTIRKKNQFINEPVTLQHTQQI